MDPQFQLTACAIGKIWRKHRRVLPSDVRDAFIPFLRTLGRHFLPQGDGSMHCARHEVGELLALLTKVAVPCTQQPSPDPIGLEKDVHEVFTKVEKVEYIRLQAPMEDECNVRNVVPSLTRDSEDQGSSEEPDDTVHDCSADLSGSVVHGGSVAEVADVGSEIHDGVIVSSSRDLPPLCPLCICRLPSKQLVVRKAGPNMGRKFWFCRKPEGERCPFFQWHEEPQEVAGVVADLAFSADAHDAHEIAEVVRSCPFCTAFSTCRRCSSPDG